MKDSLRHIIHTIPAISEEAAGPSYSVVRLCKSLCEQGTDVTLTALDYAPINVPPKFLKLFTLGLGPRKLGVSPAMYRWLERMAATNEVKLIHNHSLWMMPNIYPAWVAKKNNIPLIVAPRGTLSTKAMQTGSPVKRLFWPLIQHPALKATTCFHATAESEYQDIRRMGFKQPVAIIPNGIDVPAWQPKKQAKYRTLLFLGRIHPIKGLDMLLPAWAAVQHHFPDWQLKIVGPDNSGHLQEMKKLAIELNIERIKFTGACFGQEKWQAYRDADLFVLPTYSENFGMSVAEALAAGTPAIVTKGAPWQDLEKHRAGWWIDTSADALKSTLEKALKLPNNELEIMGQQGRDWMETEFSWQQIANMMTKTYEWVTKGGTPPDWVIID